MSNLPEGTPLFRMQLPVRWGDMDALGHVNNIMYFRYFESIRLAWMESLGYAALGTDEDGLVIVTNEVQYLRPVHYPATLDVRMAGHSPGRSSFMSTYTLHHGDELMTRGSARVVWIDVQANKSKPLPGKILSLLAGTDHV